MATEIRVQAPPPAAAAIAAPVSTAERKAAQLKATVDAFKKQAKAALSQAEYSRFQKTLQRYRAREIGVPELMETIEPAFRAAGPDKHAMLMQGFLQFLPSQERGRYSSLLPDDNDAVSPHPAPAPPPSAAALATASEVTAPPAPAPAPWVPSRVAKREEEAGSKRRTIDLITGESTAAPSKAPRLERAASLELKPSEVSVAVSHPHPLSPPPSSSHRPAPLSPAAISSRIISSTSEHPAPVPHVFATPPPRPPTVRTSASPVSKFPPFLASTPPPPPIESYQRSVASSVLISSPTALPPPPVLSPAPAAAPSNTAMAVHNESPPSKDAVAADTPDIHSPGEKEKEAPRAMGKCPVCLDAVQDPCAARCGHVLCQPCWDKQLSNKLECPVCKQKVRKSQVKRIYLG